MPSSEPPAPHSDSSFSPLDDQNVSRLLRRASTVLLLSLGLPLLLLLVTILLLLKSAYWVEHTDRVISKAYQLENMLKTMQTNFRGYRLDPDEGYLHAYEDTHRQFDSILPELETLVSDNPLRRAQLARLGPNAQAWFAFVDAELVKVRSGETGQADTSFLKQGIPLFNKLTTELEDIITAESALLAERNATQKRLVSALFTLLALLALLGIPAVAAWLQRLLRAITSSYRASVRAAEFRASELQVTLSSIGDAVVATDASGRVEFLNPVAEQLMGWSNQEARGLELSEVFKIYNEQTGTAVDNPVEKVLKENIIVGLANHTVLHARNGQELPIEDSAAPIRDAQGNVLGVILVFHDVTEKRESERLLRDSEWRLRLLNNLAVATRFLVDPVQIMGVSTRLLGEYLAVSRCAYADVQPDGEHFTILEDYTSGCDTSAGDYHLSLFGPKAVTQMGAGETLVVRDVDAELVPHEGGDMFRAIGIRAIVCCPLVKDGTLRAMMAVHQLTPRNWTPHEISLVQDVVERCWANIERARAESDLQERARLSTLRADTSRQLDSGKDMPHVLQACCELLVRHLDVSLARIWMMDDRDDILVLRGSAGVETSLDDAHARVPLGQSKIGRIAQTKLPHLTNDVAHDPLIKDSDWARSHGMHAFAGYPLLVEGTVVGVLGVFASHRLSETVLTDLEPIADAIAQHLERKRAEAALSASETLKTAILNTALDGFMLMDHAGYVRDWNSASERIFGFPREEVVGKLMADVVVPKRFREAHRMGLERYVATREAHIIGRRLELPAMRADGTEFSSELSITCIPGTEPPLFAGYVRDITDRIQSELALRDATGRAEAGALAVAESAGRFRMLAEVVSLQVWTANLKGELDFANLECEEYFGVGADDGILGNAWIQFVHPDDLHHAVEAWQKSLATGERYEIEFRLRGSGGDYRWFLVRAEAMRNAEDAIERWFGTNTDIHELKAAQGRAEQASRAKDDFLAALSHELRTPLNPVLMTAASLAQDDRLPDDVREQLSMVERNIALEARLIDDLLDLTSISRGKLPLRSQLSDAHSLIGLAVEIVRDDAQAKGIVFERDFSARLTGLMVDPARFQQVVWNLLRNAVKFTPHGGRVSIRTWDEIREDGCAWMRIEVSDTGIGIEPGALEKIFMPFEQGTATGDHRFGGVGLGLAIAQAIVDLHGGKIAARSVGENQGATFLVEFPNATEPPHGVDETSENRPDQEPSQTVSLRLLLVEDHGPTLQVLSRLLSRAGHTVTTTTNVTDARAAAATQSFDLVVSDLGLPDGTGIELMKGLRADYGLKGIALSGYGMEEDIARSLDAGFVSHLVKPVDLKQLSRAIAAAR